MKIPVLSGVDFEKRKVNKRRRNEIQSAAFAFGLVPAFADIKCSTNGGYVRVNGISTGKFVHAIRELSDPMPKITAFQCNFTLVGTPQPGQENFARAVNCIGEPKKIDDTDYISQVGIPASGIAGGDYKISSIDLYVGQAHSHYDGDSLPVLAPVRISNSEHLKFSPIKKLEIRP